MAPDIFQSLMEWLLQGIPGVMPYFNDILIFARNQTHLISILHAVLVHIQQAGLKLNHGKCRLGVNKVEFLGILIDSKGIHPTPSKVDAIKMPQPLGIRQNCKHSWGSLIFMLFSCRTKPWWQNHSTDSETINPLGCGVCQRLALSLRSMSC